MKIISSYKNLKKNLKKVKKDPFPYVIIENFLDKKFINDLLKEFPKFNNKVLHQYDNFCENKKTTNNWNSFKPYTYNLFNYLNSNEFTKILKINLLSKKLFSDGGLHGAGLSIMKNNIGKLNPHLDNAIHPKSKLLRKYNLILFLNKSWKNNWGGELCFYNKNKQNNNQHGELKKKILPKFNRCIIFDTSKDSWHSVNKIKKIKNLYRKTLQLYYFEEIKNIKKRRLKVLYSPLEHQKSNKKVLKFIKNRSNISKFFNYYKT